MTARTVVVLGGGTGGLVAARGLRRRVAPEDRVVLVEHEPVRRFAPSFLWVMTGARTADQITSDVRRQRRRGIEVVEASVQEIDPARREVVTSEGTLAGDGLVVALGAELAPDLLPGFAEGAHDLYTLGGAESAGRALREIEGGRLVVLVSRLPYKCPAAPYEAAFLAEALLRRRGVRDHVTIDVHTPERLPMPTAGEAVGTAVARMLADRGIGFHPRAGVERIDAERRTLHLLGGGRADYDVLIGIPPHRAPAAVAGSGLAGPSGFVPVDRHSMATGVERVYAIGDVTTIPLAGGRLMLPKAGVFAHAQGGVVAHRLAADLRGEQSRAAFDGTGACFLELGDGAAGYAGGDFYAEPEPRVRMRRPGRHWHLGKVAVEQDWMRRRLR